MINNPLCRRNCFVAMCYVAIVGSLGESGEALAETAQKPGPRPAAIDVTDKAAIDAALPHEVTVTGAVSEVKDSQGAATINFAGAEKSQFYAAVLKRNLETVEKVHGEGLKSLIGKRLQVTGKIAEYRNRPEIVISRPEQISIADETKAAAPGSSKGSDPRATTIDVTDHSAIEAAMPHEVVVVGVVSDVNDAEDVTMITFSGTEKSQFTAVILKRNRVAVEKVHGEGLKSLKGQRIQITGKIADYREKPQIVISIPEQVVLLDDHGSK